jgi:hypothetical protein
MADGLLSVEGLGIGSVNIAMLSGSPSFTSSSISRAGYKCHPRALVQGGAQAALR